MVTTKIGLNHNQVARLENLDELAPILFPGNRNHQKVFVAIFVELKWADDQFLPVLVPIADQHRFSRRVLETVRAKMRRMGLIDHVSRFNKRHGYREGWVFSNKFSRALERLGDAFLHLKERKDPLQEKKDRDIYQYLV